ncbi:uncharacterized protein KIAA1671 homolog isoform X2 [Rhineura floridana]|uniref:uncharacterized protein KIAA1671 homolog isoform X2 n=1 Tax=Rhineura floridana TaxID=261503 RepID=UPI002AC7F931|nr:uncharacterized protein KIAA1671 homolog isoform X2 [Rhineura floridana]
MSMMATKVEVSSALMSLSNLSELTNEATLQHAFVGCLPDTSNKPNEHPRSVSPQILEERSKSSNPVRPATVTPAAARPRLAPKPFSRERSWDTFAVVKPPIPAVKPGNIPPKPSALAPNFEDMTNAKCLSGSIPPLVDQKLIESKNTSELVTNVPVYSSVQANTVILFETRSAERSRMKLTPEKNYSPLKAQERQLPSSKPEGTVIHRQLSFSSEPKPVSWTPHRSLERKESISGAAEERAVEKHQSSSLAGEVQLRPKQRPVSAIFLELLKDYKQHGSDVSDEKPIPDKSWVRKPRPLSMDLTAKFENRDFSVQRKSCPSESEDRNLIARFGNMGRPSETGTKSEAAGLNRVDSSKSPLKSAAQVADSLSVKSKSTVQIQNPSPNVVESLCRNTPKGLSQGSAKDRKYLWELRFKSQDEQKEREMDIAAIPDKSTKLCSSKGQSVKDRMVLNHKGTCAFSENSANASDIKNKSLREGSIKKAVNFPDALANGTTLVRAESLPESPGKENKILNIQQRLKELTTENADARPGNLRQSFRSRPLSADLTRLFSNPKTAGETKPERQSELNMKSVSETRGVQEDETHPLHATDSREACVAATPWKLQQPIRMPLMDGHPERDGSFAKERQNITLQGESPALVAEHDMKTYSKSSVENALVKTVRATMFEHNVERHHIAADHFEAESTLQPTNELAEGLLGHCRESWMEKGWETKISKRGPTRQPDVSVDTERHRNAKVLNKVKVPQTLEIPTKKEKCEKPTEDSLMYQRIEPRYEILQTVGERVQSEAIAAVPEDKAVTLRSRNFLKERRKTVGSAVGASWPCDLDIQGDGWKDDCFVSKMKDTGEIATQTTTLKEVNVSYGQHVFHEQATELDKNLIGQQHAAAKGSYFTNENKDSGRTDDEASELSSGIEKRKSEVVLAGNIEGSKMLKCFPESFEAGPVRTDDLEASANVGQNITSPITSEHESQSLLCGTTPYLWQKLSSKVPLQSADPMRTYVEEDSKALRLRTCPTAHGTQEEGRVLGHRAEGHRFQQVSAEEAVRRRGRNVSTPKASERWRRKTLPHDAARFEEVGVLGQESAKALDRRDSLQLYDQSIAKRSPKHRDRVESWEGSVISPSSPDIDLKNHLSPSEPKATYFAVTYQIPGENENIPGKVFDPLKSKHISSLAEDASVTSNASNSRRSYPSCQQYSKSFSDAQDSLDRHLNKNRAERGGEGDSSDLPKKGTFKHPLTEVRDEKWMSLEKRLEDAKARVTEVEPPHLSEPKSPSYFRLLQQGSEHLGQKKCSDHSRGTAKEKSSENYRSRVLDIDALMAEYTEDSKKASVVQGKREGSLHGDSSLLSWEKLAQKRNSADKMPCGYKRRDPQGQDHPCTGQVIYATEFQASTREILESCSQELNPLKARDVKFSPPHWGRPAAEKPKNSPVDPVSTQKKTFIIDEGPGESLPLRRQSAKPASYNAQVCTLVRMDLESEASSVLHPSQVFTGGVSGKGVSLKQQTAVCADDDWRTTFNVSGVNKKQIGVSGSSLDKSRAEGSSSTSGLASAMSDFRRSYSEKGRQSRARGTLPFGKGARERQDQRRACEGFLSGSTNRWLDRRSTSQQDSFLHERTEDDLEKEWAKQDCSGSRVKNSPYLSTQWRSHSFYRDKRTDHWAADQLKQCFGRPAAEAKDTDTLVQEADSQYGTWNDQRHSGDRRLEPVKMGPFICCVSLGGDVSMASGVVQQHLGTQSFMLESPSSESNVAPPRKQPPSSRFSSFSSQTDPASAATDRRDSSREQRSTSLDHSSTDVDSADGTDVPAAAGASPDFSFLDQTPVLDSSALKTRVQLSKRRRQHRAPISHSLRRSTGGDTELQLSATEEADSAWMFKDSTEKSAKREVSDEEEKPHPTDRSPVSQPQRLPVFPGMDHSVLKAQLRKRHEPEGTGEGSPAHLSRSPKSPFQTGAPSGRVPPTGTEKEERSEETSPQWLKELKSKKRQSQYENQV